MNIAIDRDSRHGLTLLEIPIVMVKLIAVAALSIPTVQRSFSAQKVSKGADLVRAELNRARVRAMRTGEIHAFFYQNDTANFKVAAFNNEMNRILNESFRQRNETSSSNFDFDGNTLPRGIRFIGSDAVEDARSASTMNENPGAADLRPILFYPDGSSQTARIYLRSEDSDVAEIRLRGMTGTSSSSLVDYRR